MHVGTLKKHLTISLIYFSFVNLATASNLGFYDLTSSQNDPLVELPDYKKPDLDEDISIYGESYSYFKKTVESCSPSKTTYVPQVYVENYSQFPLVPKTPILEDQLAVYFFKNLQDEQFYVTKWGVPSDETLITFHLTPQARKYKKVIEQVIEHINTKAHHYGLISKANNLIELASKTLNLDQESCDVQIIHFEEEETGGPVAALLKSLQGVAFLKRDYEHSDRLGEIRDADITIYPGNIRRSKQFNYDYEKMDKTQQEQVISKKIYKTLMHEIFHALGVDHNFALGTVMDYDELYFDSDFDFSLAYEMDVLNFLYHGKAKTKNWPLVRTKNSDHVYIPDEKHFYVSEQWYHAKIIDGSVDFLCTDINGKKTDYSEHIVKNFQLQLTYDNEEHAFINYADFDFEIKHLIAESVFSVQQRLKNSEYKRLLPGLIIDTQIAFPEDYDDDQADYYIHPNKQEAWVYPSPFIFAYGFENDISHIDWEFDVHYPNKKRNLECNLKADFRIIVGD